MKVILIIGLIALLIWGLARFCFGFFLWAELDRKPSEDDL